MKREFIKGNEAIAKAALLAGCTQYYGYPITPSSEVIHTCAQFFPKAGANFVQAESEVAAIMMCYGASSAGKRVLTASSSPGISLKQEGISYMAGAELPVVIINVQRAGPGLGNIWPEQSDYFQSTRVGGHGNYRTVVLAPNSPQEMCDMTIEAFEIADKYRMPVLLLTDAYIGQVMEPVTFPDHVKKVEKKDWAVYGNKESKDNLITSIMMDTKSMEDHNIHLLDKYKEIEENEVQFSEYLIDDADMVVVAYGITSRVAKNSIDDLRAKGIKVGLFRPVTLWPFPSKRVLEISNTAKVFTVLELSAGQMVEDIKLTLNGKLPVEFYGRMGGAIPTVDELSAKIEEYCKKHFA